MGDTMELDAKTISKLLDDLVDAMGNPTAYFRARSALVAAWNRRALPADTGEHAELMAWPVGDAYVTWYEPQEIPSPGKLIDCSLAVIDQAQIGDRFYSETQVRQLLAANQAAGMTREQVVRLLEKKFAATGLSYDAFGASVGLSGEFIRNVLLEKRPPSKAILDLLGLRPVVAYYAPGAASPHSGSHPPAHEVSGEAKTWRCFHCDEVFSDEHGARLHFGRDEGRTPACQIKGAEGSLVEALRRSENDAADAWFTIHNESTDAAKAYFAQNARHQEQLRAVEQLGYDRGIADAKAHPEVLGLALASPNPTPGPTDAT